MAGEKKFVSWGYEVRTSSIPCISAINNYAHEVLSNGKENLCIFKAPEYDPKCVLANTLAAYVARSRGDLDWARVYLDAAESHQEQATPYEKAVLEAVKYLITARDDDGAVDKHSGLLRNFPKDILSLKRAQVLCFYMGKTREFLQLVEMVLEENMNANYIHGIHAFALQEVGGVDNMKKAEEAGEKAFKINPQDAATHHALCHIYQYTTRFKKAVDFMLQCSTSWTDLQSFTYTHNWWHVCLCYFEGFAPMWKVWEIHNQYMWKELEKPDAMRGKVYLNAIGLLLRVHIRAGYEKALRGYDASMLKRHLDILTQTLMTTDLHSIWKREWFLDILILWVLSHKSKDAEANELLEALESKVTGETNMKKKQRMSKGLKLAKASYNYGKGDYKKALEHFGDDFNAVDYKVIGASTEQIDVYNEVYMDAQIQTENFEKALKFAEKKSGEREDARFLCQVLEKASKGLGKDEIAVLSGLVAAALELILFPDLPDYKIN